jgi:hypothetical protein
MWVFNMKQTKATAKKPPKDLKMISAKITVKQYLLVKKNDLNFSQLLRDAIDSLNLK